MTSNRVPQPRLRINQQQVLAGSILFGVGGALAMAGAAVAGLAVLTAFRQRVQQMDVPPSELARQHWSAVKQATTAGRDVWLKEQPAGQRQTAGHR